jgi:hypothetical protein
MAFNPTAFRNALVCEFETNRRLAEALNHNGQITKDNLTQYIRAAAVAQALYAVIKALDEQL